MTSKNTKANNFRKYNKLSVSWTPILFCIMYVIKFGL